MSRLSRGHQYFLLSRTASPFIHQAINCQGRVQTTWLNNQSRSSSTNMLTRR